MPALFVFLLKVNIALLLFCAGYYLVLRHLTFYTLNRIYLVSAILFASIYPKINLDDFAQRHQQLTRPVQVVMLNLRTPAEALVKPLTQPGYWYWLEMIFWLGAAVLAIRLLMQLFSLYKLHRASIPMMIRDHRVRIMHGDAGPFSFWRSIYVNPANHDAADLKAILQHEQVHVNEWHTLDVLLAEISTIFYWFNPGIWLMKRAVRENIEFITDQKLLNTGIDSKEYQYSLVNVSFSASPQNIVNNFNFSTIKKRIIMMNAKKSSKFNLTRYAFLVPTLVICLLTFSFSKAELVKRSKIAYTAISKSVLKLNFVKTVDHKVSQLSGAVVNLIAPVKDTNKTSQYSFSYTTSDTTKKHKHDTVKIVKGHLSYTVSSDSLSRIVIDGAHGVDNAIYVIDGKVVKYHTINTIDPKNIVNVNVEKGEGDEKGVVYITTRDGAPAITSVRVNGYNIKSSNHIYINGALAKTDSLKLIKGHIDSVYIASGKALTLRSNVYRGSGRIAYTLSDSARGDQKKILLDKMQSVTVVGRARAGKNDSIENKVFGLKVRQANTLNLTYAKRNRENNIENLSSKLIFIDGKEASERDLKKLSAASIESMSAQSGDDIVKKYGDKAKDGVLFITTKKAR
ncbi:MAG: M56 family metallopeptidase [Mucilaginibacter sp.]